MSATFKQETVQKLLANAFKEEKTKLPADMAKLVAEVMKVFVQEACCRAKANAEAESSDVITIEHFEKILPQLLLDF